MHVARFFLHKLVENIWSRLPVKPQEGVQLEPDPILPLATNEEVLRGGNRRLSISQRDSLQTAWRQKPPDPQTYEQIADETSQAFAQRRAEQGKSDPRNDAANASVKFEIDQLRGKALRKAIGLNPNRKE